MDILFPFQVDLKDNIQIFAFPTKQFLFALDSHVEFCLGSSAQDFITLALPSK